MTPRADGYVPSTLFFGRVLRGNLPSLPEAHATNLREARKIANDKYEFLQNRYQKSNSKRSKHPKLDLKVGDMVLVQELSGNFKPGKWRKKAKILKYRSSNRSYVVETEDGRTLLRNRRYLRPLKVA